jgi:glucose/arabinose dehydrogenase
MAHREHVLTSVIATLLIGGVGTGTLAQQERPAPPRQGFQTPEVATRTEPPATRFFYPTGPSMYVPLPKEPSVFDTSQHRIRVVTVANGLSRPFSMVFLPDGRMLVAERTGQIRVIRNGTLEPQPIAGVPQVAARSYQGLMDLALHPRFAENRLLYFTYAKGGPNYSAANALGRGRLEGNELKNVEELFVAEKWTSNTPTLSARIAFAPDGLLYMAVASPGNEWERAQDPSNHQGKVLRLKDDGTPAPGNPFAGKPGYKPEIFTLGHRNPLGLAVHPETGAVFQNENGPQGGDEINILKPGANYGWPIVSQGRDYSGRYYPEHRERPGFEPPFIEWNPSVALSGMTFYTGDKFPKWKGHIFVGSLSYAHLERVPLNEKGEPRSREWMLVDLKQRIRDVRQGPDGLLYVLTDHAYGALLRIEPAPEL